MFGIGMPEMILILAVALIVIGPKKLPDIARSLGQALGEFKKATRELKDAIEIESEIDTVKDAFIEAKHPLTKNDEDETTKDITDTPIPPQDLSESSENEPVHRDKAQKDSEGSLEND